MTAVAILGLFISSSDEIALPPADIEKERIVENWRFSLEHPSRSRSHPAWKTISTALVVRHLITTNQTNQLAWLLAIDSSIYLNTRQHLPLATEDALTLFHTLLDAYPLANRANKQAILDILHHEFPICLLPNRRGEQTINRIRNWLDKHEEHPSFHVRPYSPDSPRQRIFTWQTDWNSLRLQEDCYLFPIPGDRYSAIVHWHGAADGSTLYDIYLFQKNQTGKWQHKRCVAICTKHTDAPEPGPQLLSFGTNDFTVTFHTQGKNGTPTTRSFSYDGAPHEEWDCLPSRYPEE
ncbi:hypothetical protein ICN84_00805 [Akkermansia glycaniphila]|uniref:hypothetical protein n=1 Tax=Akkermansia glycaniphila TaxID=1679444 RepID=UPI001C016053|nr:hypothetical protein [Akkermansia glycaniphila]MBT9448611.1 hypothetical protein [Akkermansia glycaniphila]